MLVSINGGMSQHYKFSLLGARLGRVDRRSVVWTGVGDDTCTGADIGSSRAVTTLSASCNSCLGAAGDSWAHGCVDS